MPSKDAATITVVCKDLPEVVEYIANLNAENKRLLAILAAISDASSCGSSHPHFANYFYISDETRAAIKEARGQGQE